MNCLPSKGGSSCHFLQCSVDVQISENTIARQRNVTFQAAHDRIFMDGYSKYEDDNSDNGWEPESDETEEEESETG